MTACFCVLLLTCCITTTTAVQLGTGRQVQVGVGNDSPRGRGPAERELQPDVGRQALQGRPVRLRHVRKGLFLLDANWLASCVNLTLKFIILIINFNTVSLAKVVIYK